MRKRVCEIWRREKCTVRILCSNAQVLRIRNILKYHFDSVKNGEIRENVKIPAIKRRIITGESKNLDNLKIA